LKVEIPHKNIIITIEKKQVSEFDGANTSTSGGNDNGGYGAP